MSGLDVNKSIVIEFYEAFSSNTIERFNHLLSPDFINHPGDPGRSNDREGFKLGVTDFHAAFEEFHIHRDALICEGNLVVCRITMTGRHIAALGNWQPNREHVTFHGMDMHRIDNRKIVETWHFERFTQE